MASRPPSAPQCGGLMNYLRVSPDRNGEAFTGEKGEEGESSPARHGATQPREVSHSPSNLQGKGGVFLGRRNKAPPRSTRPNACGGRGRAEQDELGKGAGRPPLLYIRRRGSSFIQAQCGRNEWPTRTRPLARRARRVGIPVTRGIRREAELLDSLARTASPPDGRRGSDPFNLSYRGCSPIWSELLIYPPGANLAWSVVSGQSSPPPHASSTAGRRLSGLDGRPRP